MEKFKEVYSFESENLAFEDLFEDSPMRSDGVESLN